MSYPAVQFSPDFAPFMPQSHASNGASHLANRLADLIRSEPSLLGHPDRLNEALERDRRSTGSGIRVVESGTAHLDGTGAAVLVVVVGQDEDRVPSEDEIRIRFGLTRRESTVAWCLAHRQSNEEIARALGVSPHTARHHTERVLGKLKVHSRRAVRGVLLSPVTIEELSGGADAAGEHVAEAPMVPAPGQLAAEG